MSDTIRTDDFRAGLLTILEELFETERNYILDDGEHYQATLGGIDAETASRVIAPGVATLAAQVTHVEFLIDGLINYFGEQLDWGAAWQVTSISDDDWADLNARLLERYGEIRTFVQSNANWDAMMIGGAFALVAHIAYHLGQIRALLGVLVAG